MNHKWEKNKCIKCGIIRAEIKSVDDKEQDILMYQYSDDGKNWIIKRPDCHIQINNNIETNSVKPFKNFKQDYSELLRNPKWQRKRLEIMQRDNWMCKSCNDDLNELHVHHLQYTVDKPWDEPDENLVTLCNTCHKALHYLTACPDMGLETFILLIRYLDNKEQENILKWVEYKSCPFK